jgi:hypothetical protein
MHLRSTCVNAPFSHFGPLQVDQHSVGWSGGHFLLYHEQLRLALLMDPSHRCARDLNLAYSDADCWGSILLMSSCWNLNFGPWNGSKWHKELASVANTHSRTHTAATCSLFQSMLAAMSRDRDEEDCLHDPAWQQQVAGFRQTGGGVGSELWGPERERNAVWFC